MSKRSKKAAGKGLTFDQYTALAELEERRERNLRIRANFESHEPRSAYGGLCSMEDYDGDGRITGARAVDRKAFVRVDDLPEDAINALKGPDLRDADDPDIDFGVACARNDNRERIALRPGVFRRRAGTLVPLAA